LAGYYLDQARGRVDVFESIGGALKDYYAGAAAHGVLVGEGGEGPRPLK
jgi:hypothetical protein